MQSFRQIVVSFVVSLIVLVVSVASTAAQQTGAISGLVSDQTGASVAGARVELLNGQSVVRSVTTDTEGRYRFDGLATGDYAVRVTAARFQPAERRVSAVASGAAVANIQLNVPALAESVVVTETREKAAIEAERAATPGGVTVIESEELFRRQVNGLADMLRYVPGVWAESSSGSEELFFSSRGSNLDSTDYDKNGIKLLQDGLPVTTADGNNHNRVIDPLSARYTSIARGANALTYGASTLGGAIDFTSPTARNSDPLSVFLNTGSHGAFNGRATIGGTRGAMDGLFTIEGRQWDGYRDHSSQERLGIYANSGWRPSATTTVQMFGTFVHNDIRLPGALTRKEVDANPNQASAAALDGNYGKVVKTGRGAVKVTRTFGAGGSLTAGLSYEGQSLFHPIVNQIFVDFDGPGPNAPVEVFSLLVDTDHRDLGAMVRYDRRVNGHDFLIGLNVGKGSVTGGNYRNLKGQPNGIAEEYDSRSDSVEAFALDRWRASERLTAVFGAQMVSAGRNVRVTNAATSAVSNPDDRYLTFNPRAGVIAAVDDRSEAYANISRLFEAPTTFQMIDQVRGGDATLNPMSGTVAEIGWRSRTTEAPGMRWTWDIAAFYARINDEILSIDDPNAPGNSLVTNIEKTTHAGIEALGGASIDVGAAHRLEPTLSLTINRFRFAEDPTWGTNRLPAAPQYALRGEMLYKHARGFYAGPTFDLIGDRYVDFANSYTVDGYGLMGLRAGLSRARWELFGEVRNLFDTKYIATLGVLNVAAADARVLYPGAPVSAYVGLRLSR